MGLAFDPAGLEVARRALQPSTASATLVEQLGAAALLENTAGALFEASTQPTAPTSDPVEGFDPLAGATLAEIERFGHRLAQARSPQEVENLREQYQRRDALEQTIGSGPLPPWLAVMGVSIADPVNLIPILGMARVAGRAPTVGRLAAAGAYGGVAGSALVEAVISPLQPTREGSESFANILMGGATGAALLAGVGGAIAGGAAVRRWVRPGVIEDATPDVRRDLADVLRDSEAAFDAAAEYAARVMRAEPLDARAERELLESLIARAEEVQQAPGQARLLEDILAAEGAPRAAGEPVPMPARGADEPTIALDEVIAATQPPARDLVGGSVGAALRDEVLDRQVREVLRNQRLRLVHEGLFRPVFQALRATGILEFPGVSLLTSRFQTSRRFISQFADTGMQIEATVARPMTKQELDAAFKELQQRGVAVSREEFEELAAYQSQFGLSVAEQAPTLTRIEMAKNTALVRVMNTRNVKFREAQGQGFTGTIHDWDETIYRLDNELEEFAPGAPATAEPAWLPVAREHSDARKAHYRELHDYITRSGVWDEIDYRPASAGDYTGAKIFDRGAVERGLPAFIDRLEAQLTRMVRDAEARLDEYTQRVDDWEGRLEERRAYAESINQLTKDTSLPAPARAEARQLRDALGAENARVRDLAALRKELKEGPFDPKVNKRTGGYGVDTVGEMRELARGLPSAQPDFERLMNAIQKVRNAHEEVVRAHALLSQRVALPELPQPPMNRPSSYPMRAKDQATIEKFHTETSDLDFVISPERIRAEATAMAQEIAFGPIERPTVMAGRRISLKGRELDVDPAEFEGFLLRNTFFLDEMYLTTVTRDVEVFRTFGALNHEKMGIVKELRDEATQAIEELARRQDLTEAQRQKQTREIQDKLRGDEDLIRGLVELARGQRGVQISSLGRGAALAARNVMSLTYTNTMGPMIFSQLPDAAKATLSYGAARFFGEAFREVSAGLKSLRGAEKLKGNLQYGAAADLMLGDIQAAVWNASPRVQAGDDRFTAGLTRVTNAFSKLTLGPQWNDALRGLGQNIATDGMTRLFIDIAAGRVPADEDMLRAAARAGLTRRDMEQMGRLMQAEARPRADRPDLMDPGYERWLTSPALKDASIDALGLMEKWRTAVNQTAREALLAPTVADKPLLLQTTVGALMTQFLTFTLIAVAKLTGAVMQAGARRQMETVIVALGLAAAATALRDIAKQGKVEERTAAQWANIAVDRSGLIGLLYHFDSGLGAAGLPNLQTTIGGEDRRRYSDRSLMSYLAGPGISKGFDAIRGAAAVAQWPLDKRTPRPYEIGRLRALIPFQNHFLMVHAFDAIEEASGGRKRSVFMDALGAR